MLELIEISDIVINTDSSTTKECVMLDTPLVNFHLKVDPKRYHENRPFLYDYFYPYDFHSEVKPDFESEDIKSRIEYLTSNDFSDDFKDARGKYLFDKGTNVSAKILDELL
jgi:hypothetical protein